VLIAGGVIGISAGVAFHLVRENRASHFNDIGCEVSNGVVSGPEADRCQVVYNDIQTNTRYAIAGYAGGVALGGVGLVLLLMGGGGDAAPSSGSTALLHCSPTLDAVGLACGGRF